MEPPPCTEASLHVQICRAGDETVSRPKFTFVPGAERVGHFTLTRRSLAVLRFLFHSEACQCAEAASPNAMELWRLMGQIARECFWFVVAVRESRYIRSTFSLIEYDVPLCFDSYGLLLLGLTPGDSFLHVNSGTGYACSIASFLLGANGINHGVEFRGTHRKLAQENRENMLRFCPELQEKATPPFYHAGFPADLLEGKSKFSKVLVTDCFQNLREIYALKRLLTSGGILVTSLIRERNGDMEISMLMLKRGEIINDSDDDWGSASHMFHGVRRGMFRHIIRIIHKEKFNTLSRLETARLNTGKQLDMCVTADMPSLRSLALRSLSKQSDPMRPLLGDCACLLRISTRGIHLPNLSAQLGTLVAAITSFQSQCLVTEDDNFEWLMATVKIELAHVVVALEGLGKQFIGSQEYSLWKCGDALQLPVQQGVMVWILENIFHLVRYSWDDYNFCCYADVQCVFESVWPDWAASDDSVSQIVVMEPLLKAFLKTFRTINLQQVLDHRPPWNYHLSYAKQMKRTLTKLAARFWVDAFFLVNIIRAMMKLCEVKEKPLWYRSVLVADLDSIHGFLTALKDEVEHQSEAFISIQTFQDKFLDLTQKIKCLQRSFSFLMADGQDNAEVQELSCCMRFLACSALRNLVGSGRVQDCSNPSLQFRSVNEGGSLMDSDVFRAEVNFLVGSGLGDVNPVEDACHFLVRRFAADLTEVVWMSEGVQADKTLATLEKDLEFYHREVLKKYLPIDVIEKLLDTDKTSH